MKYKELQFKNKPDIMLNFAFSYSLEAFFVKVAIKDFDFFNKFKKEGMHFEEIKNKYKIKNRGLNVLLSMFLTHKLLNYKNKKYHLTPITKEYLLKNSEKYVGDFVTWGYDYKQYAQVILAVKDALLKDKVAKTTQELGDWVASFENQKIATKFMNVMDQRGIYLANEVTKKIDLKNNKNILDVGGSSGIYSCFIAEKYKKLNIDILEIPALKDVTEKVLAERKYAKRIGLKIGDMFTYKPDKEYDAYLFSNVLHDWDEKDVCKLIKKTYTELPMNGKIIIHDGHLKHGENDKGLITNNLAIYLFTKGRYYYYDEIKQILKDSGFKNIKTKETVMGRSLITGVK